MKKVKIFPENSFIKNIDFSSNIQYNLFVDFIPDGVNSSEINILLLCEPDIITNIVKDLADKSKMFNFVFTHNQKVLDSFDNAILFTFNSVWVSDKIYEPKEFTISTVVGHKTWTKNQRMRHELWAKQEQILNRKFFVGYGGPSNEFNNPILSDNKDAMFFSQFHIAIENCSIENYFTEKILDCFISKTVPIYCGCSNIGNYFNEKGIISFSNIKECVEICKNLTEKTYEEMLSYVEENYERAKEYINWEKRIADLLKKIEK